MLTSNVRTTGSDDMTSKMKNMPYLKGAIWIAILSFFDALATDVGIRMHVVQEANPFARLLYEAHVAIFYGYKIGLPLVLIALLPFLRQRAFINKIISLTVIVYLLLAFYHIVWISLSMFLV